jgi:hypothetical protein
VHKEFWDGVNFRNGANPPRECWKKPPQKSPAETRAAFGVFEDYLRFIKHFPEVRFITASQAARLYHDKGVGRRYTPNELWAVARAVRDQATFQTHGDYALSAAEALALLNDYVLERSAGKNPVGVTLWDTVGGPTGRVPVLTSAVTTDWSQFTRTAADVADFLKKRGRVPSTVWLGSVGVPPEAYLRALAEVMVRLADGQPAPETVEVKPARFGAAKYVAEDGPGLWGWVIFPKGFRAPALMELARREAWTLKPAVLDRSAE